MTPRPSVYAIEGLSILVPPHVCDCDVDHACHAHRDAATIARRYPRFDDARLVLFRYARLVTRWRAS